MNKTTRKFKGSFTLIEIIIAIGIIIALSALSINSLVRSKITAYETAAIKGLRTVQAAFEYYRLANTDYPTNFNQLCNSSPPYLDSRWIGSAGDAFPAVLHSLTIKGYSYEILFSENDHYTIAAHPTELRLAFSDSIREFYITQDGEIFEGAPEDEGAVVTLKSAEVEKDVLFVPESPTKEEEKKTVPVGRKFGLFDLKLPNYCEENCIKRCGRSYSCRQRCISDCHRPF